MAQLKDNPHRKKHVTFFRKTRSEAHQSSDLPPLSTGSQYSQGSFSSLRSKAKGLFARRASATRCPNPSQLDPPLADVVTQPAQFMVPEEVADECPNMSSTHPSISLEVPHSDNSDKLPKTDQSMQDQTAHGAESNNSTTKVTNKPDSDEANAARRHAREAVSELNPIFGSVQAAASGINTAGGPVTAVDNVTSFLGTLSKFNTLVDTIAEIHPYAKAVWGILSVVSKVITSQATRDDSINQLLSKMDEVYMFLAENDLAAITSMKSVVVRICQQTLECSYFLRDYSKSKNFWIRLGRNVVAETDNTVKGYNTVFNDLMQQFRDRAARDTVVVVHRMLEGIQELIEGADLSGMKCAEGAGLDTRKKCLPGTREDILDEITTWVNNTEDGAPCVFWLHGNAGTGKSSIAHTIADRFRGLGRLGSCYCFDRTRAAQRRHEEVFTTIARGLADRDEQMRHALADIVHHDSSLTNTPDIMQQWKELIVKPASKLSGAMVGPTLIVIEALDESGEDTTRRHLLQILAGKSNDDETHINKLPSNFRFFVTSRPLLDIHNVLNGVEHILQKSMDSIPLTTTEHDILHYVTNELLDIDGIHGDELLTSLTRESGGLFEWARLACAYIKGDNDPGLIPSERFEAIISHKNNDQVPLLDQMYEFTLKSMFPKNQPQREKRLARFCSVMAQVLGTLEPLPLASLRSMRRYFPEDNPDVVTAIIKPMGALLSGTTNPSSVVRPLHASFPDFLTDKKRSGEFFVDTSCVHKDLAFASLVVMERDLRFNICKLSSSYLPNSKISDLHERVKQHIFPELSYSCRFWTDHLRKAVFNLHLADAVRAFFNHERLLFWLEVLSLLKTINMTADLLSCVIEWVKPHPTECKDILDNAADAQRFIRMFGLPISFSTPHLYLSALPFSPKESRIFTKFSSAFPSVLRIPSGHNLSWPVIQQVMHAGYCVQCAAFSPDGKRIVVGLFGGIIQVWDAETGERLRPPLVGHEGLVMSVAFSPDGRRIVSGSEDRTIRLWDAESGDSLGPPLEGHEHMVTSVAFSPNGRHIVSGSRDKTIRLWDAETGKPLRLPLLGHTSPISSVTFSPDSTRIVSGSWGEDIKLWNAETGKLLLSPLKGLGWVHSIAFSPDGKCIVSGSSNNIQLWDADTGEPLSPPLVGHKRDVYSVAFSQNGKQIVSGSLDGTIRLWDTESGKPLRLLQGHTTRVTSVAFSPDGLRILSGSWDKTIRLWEATTDKSLQSSSVRHSLICCAAFSPDGERIMSVSRNNTFRLWNAGIGEHLWPPLEGPETIFIPVALSLNGKRVVSVSYDGTILLWNAETGKPLRPPLEGHKAYVTSVAFSPDSRRIVSGSKDRTVQLWDAETGDSLSSPLEGHKACVTCVAFSPDSRHIVTGSEDRTIRLWDVETGDSLSISLEGYEHIVTSVAFSPNGRHIVLGSRDGIIRLWDIKTGEPLRPSLEGHRDAVMSVAFSPNGKLIVSGSRDKTICLWDAETGKLLRPLLQGHEIISVAFSPDGQRIMSLSYDNTMRLWDVEAGETPQPLHVDGVSSGAVSPDEIDVMSVSKNPIIHAHDAQAIRDRDLKHLIRFSLHPGHALVDPTALLDEITAPTQDRSALPVRIREHDKWAVVGQEDRLLFWAPPTYNPRWCPPGVRWVVPAPDPPLDLSHMAHGISWESCYGGHARV